MTRDYHNDEPFWDDESARPMKVKVRCPNPLIQYCPLYVACHDQRAEVYELGCIDDLQGPCMVQSAKVNYQKQVSKLYAINPEMVEMCKFRAAAEDSREQRARNLRENGIR